MNLSIRKASAADRQAVIDIIQATDFFRPVEIEIACEVFDEAAADKPGNTYQSYTAQADGTVVGWICFGPTPCTLGTFDVYWIAVHPAMQRHHIGTRLLAFAEAEIRRQNGRLIVNETSGSEKYLPTRYFYQRSGYVLAAEVKDFYAPGDAKWIFTKTIA
ncbi:MAG: GNAT family N-acetyltransferase [Phycisphaerae bacterium]|nr:GNAT family N-acetyltransferase [Phycisphaerae bacterium]